MLTPARVPDHVCSRRHCGVAWRGFPMEFHIKMADSLLDIGTIDDAIRAVDASALVDIDPAGNTLRVATSVGAAELVSLLSQAGYPVTPHQVVQLPSICCGGCSG